MIYIITPFLGDFENICHSKNLKKGHDVLWVDKIERLRGHKIQAKDIIIKGDKFLHFTPDIIKHFEVELAMRTRDK